MSAMTPENVIIRAIHEAFIKYPEGEGGPNLDYLTNGFSRTKAPTSLRSSFWNWLPTVLKL
jgi:hypothetical protein